MPGAYELGEDTEHLTPAPPPGDSDRHRWKSKLLPKGPVGLLMQHTHMFAAAINFTYLAVVRTQRADLPILEPPFQLPKPTMVRFAFDALQRVTSTKRAMLAGATDVDPRIYHKATVELGRKDANIV